METISNQCYRYRTVNYTVERSGIERSGIEQNRCVFATSRKYRHPAVRPDAFEKVYLRVYVRSLRAFRQFDARALQRRVILQRINVSSLPTIFLDRSSFSIDSRRYVRAIAKGKRRPSSDYLRDRCVFDVLRCSESFTTVSLDHERSSIS